MDKMNKISFVLILSIALAYMATACLSDTDNALKRIKKTGYVTIGISSGYPPFCFYNKSKELVGYDVDVANEIAKGLGVKAKFIDTDWKDIITHLNEKKYDFIVSSMSITNERMKLVDFSIPYYHSKSVVLFKVNAPFKSNKDFKGRTVGIEEGTTYEEDAKLLESGSIRSFKTIEQAIEALQNNAVDGVITDEVVATYLKKTKNYNFVISDEHIRKGKMAVAFRKGDKAIINKVNGIIKKMQDDGTLRKLSEKILKDTFKQ